MSGKYNVPKVSESLWTKMCDIILQLADVLREDLQFKSLIYYMFFLI